MQVVSVNTGEKRTITWRGKQVETGIFKEPVGTISLGITDVDGDNVVDRRVHGGVDKACYLFSSDTYAHWKSIYPNLNWNWGMFGENITVSGLDESSIFIGSTYQIGTAQVEVSQPRQPCFKLGIRFGTQEILKQFIKYGRPGAYVRVIKPGDVRPGDAISLMQQGSEISIQDIFQLLYDLHSNPSLVSRAIGLSTLAESARRDLQRN